MDNNAKTSGSAMNALTGTKTLKNLGTAFGDEAKAYALYNLFSAAAYDEGYPNAASLFTNIAENEIQHAALWLGYMDGIGTTPENLRVAAANEREDAQTYLEMARTADDEGFSEIAEKFRLTSAVETGHENTYNQMIAEIEQGKDYGDACTHWRCTNCGFEADGNVRPERCPLCSYPGAYFRVENA